MMGFENNLNYLNFEMHLIHQFNSSVQCYYALLHLHILHKYSGFSMSDPQ